MGCKGVASSNPAAPTKRFKGQSFTGALSSFSGGPSFASAVTYDAASGRVNAKTYPTGLQVGYQYTTRGYLEKLVMLTSTANVNPLPDTNGHTAAAGTLNCLHILYPTERDQRFVWFCEHELGRDDDNNRLCAGKSLWRAEQHDLCRAHGEFGDFRRAAGQHVSNADGRVHQQ